MNDDQKMLRDALIGRLATKDGDAAWAELGQADVLWLCVPTALGGLGLCVADATPVMEALGEYCLPTPFLENSIIAVRLLTAARSAEGDRLLCSLTASGGHIAVAGLDSGLWGDLRAESLGGNWTISGTARLVLDTDKASALLVIAPNAGLPALFLLPGDAGSERHHYATIDGRKASDIRFDQEPATLLIADASEIVEAVTDEAIACLAVEAAALMARLVRDTVDYAKQRQQFGQPIAKFQVVQHRLVDMNIQARRAAAIASRAMAALAETGSERARVVSAAKVTVAQAGRSIGQQAVQLHGGMGMTMELTIGRYFKRLTVIEGEFGNADRHLQRYAATLVA